MKRAFQILCGLLCICLMLVLYAFFIEPYRFIIHRETIALSNQALHQLSIVQLSDIEIKEQYQAGQLQKHVEEINALTPDIIVFTGDLFNNYATYGPFEEVLEVLSSLKSTIGNYAIYGNKDYGGGAVRIYETLMQSAGFTVLTNEVVQLSIDQQPFQLVGVDSFLMGSLDNEGIQQQLQTNIPTIVLTHEPEMIDSLTFSYDLLLAGHTHGGQVAIPLLQTIFDVSETPYQKGIYQIKDHQFVYVDSGLGTSRLPIRFLNPPQVSYLTIQF